MSLIYVVLPFVLTVMAMRLYDRIGRRGEFESRIRLLERVDRALRVCSIPHDPSLDLPRSA